MSVRGRLYIVLGLLFLMGEGSSLAAIINVPTDQPTIQAAIDAAATGDEVAIAPGTYHECINFHGKAITVRSTDPDDPGVVAATVINADAGGSVVTFNTSENASSILTGLTLTNGSFPSGGGVYVKSASPTIRGNVITANASSGSAGGVYSFDGSPTITGNTITGNTTAGVGGGILCSKGSPLISQNTITGNSANSTGGGIACQLSNVTISANVIRANSAVGNGGGIVSSQSNLTISGNIISDNVSGGNGGGMSVYDGTATIDGNTICGNTVGGSYHGAGLTLSFMDSATVANTVVAFAGASDGINRVYGSLPVVRYCDVYGFPAGSYYGMADPTGSNGNISEDPLFADAAGGDYHLQSIFGRWAGGGWVTDLRHSPCIDAGDPTGSYALEPLPNGSRLNIGAFGNTPEASKGNGLHPPFTPTSVVISPASPTTDDDLTCLAAAADPDGGSLTYEQQWAMRASAEGDWGGWEHSGPTLAATLTSKGQQWKVRARAFDGTFSGPWRESSAVTVGDTAPSAPTDVAITPASPVTTDDLTASASGASDPDQDEISYAYQWASSDNGTDWSAWGNDGATLDAASTAKGQWWKAQARAVAGGAQSGWTESAAVRICNAPPGAPTVVVTPQQPRTDDDLVAQPQAADDDGDSLSYQVQWASRSPETGWSDWRNDGATLDPSLTARGQRWKARARAYDGADYGAWAESGTVTVQDTPPSAPTLVQVRPPGAASGVTLRGYAEGGSDADGDEVTYRFQWRHSGDGGTTWDEWTYPGRVLAVATRKGEVWQTRARSCAGDRTSTWAQSASLTVTDSPPGPPAQVTITPAQPTSDRNLRATADGAVDPDGDPITAYVYQWNRSDDGGATWSGWLRNGSVVPSDVTSPGEQWKARARARSGDPALRGEWTESLPVTISEGAAAPAPALTAAAVPAAAGNIAISLNLTAAATVRIRILNLAGREVAVLPELALAAGPRTLLWNGRGTGGTAVPAGQYLVDIRASAAQGARCTLTAPVQLAR